MYGTTPGGTTSMVASRVTSLQDMFLLWIAGLDVQTLGQPDRCDFGLEEGGGKLYRFRWFGAINISGTNYGLGANLHSNGAMGSIWMQGAGQTAPELHPRRQPRNPKTTDFQAFLRGLVQDGTFGKLMKAQAAEKKSGTK